MSVPKVIQDIRGLKSEISSIKGSYLTSNKTVYVTTTGNDTTGSGSQAAPYRTINKAVSTIPKNLNGYDVTINIAAGSYQENISISNFHGGLIFLNGVTNADISATSITVINCKVFVNNIRFIFNRNGNWDVLVTNGASLTFNAELILNGSHGIQVNYSKFASNSFTTVTLTSDAVRADASSTAYFSWIRGTCGSTGLMAIAGSKITFSTNGLAATVLYYTSSGGRVYGPSQTSVPNY